jgi:glycosyltransferase involved in cell wall biosynthesis
MSKLVSIIIPCLNEEEYIGACLESILSQNYPRDLIEVFVVDGGSTDQSIAIINSYSNINKHIKLLRNPDKITPVSLNLGLKKAQGDFVCILGGHSTIKQDFITNGVKELNCSQAMVVGGPVTHIGYNKTGEAIALAMQSQFGVGNSIFRTAFKRQCVDTVAFGMYRKEIFHQIGNFNEALIRNQDFELNQRITQAGHHILFSPSINSTYYTRNSLASLFKQYFQYGFWKVQVIRINIHSFKLRYQVPLLFILLGIFLVIGSIISPQIFLIFKALIVTYFVTSIFFSIHLMRWKNPHLLLVMPVVFFILHTSFGLGLCSGFFSSLFLRKIIKLPS